MKFDLGDVQVHKRKRLPHWDTQHGYQFITFNLFDAIPSHVRARIREEAEAQLRIIQTARGEATIAEKNAIRDWEQAKLGETLDEDHGSCFMRDERIAEIVANAIVHFDGKRYELLAWCVMPNHVHAVLTLSDGETMDRLLHSWKSFTSKEANKVLRRRGQFWQEDFWDHAIRDLRELRETIEYVLNNPPVGWKFVRFYPERIPF